jgi:predicted TIM-barrel fold metal-dependent hydrolase
MAPILIGPLVDTHAHIYLTNQPLVDDASHRPERAFTTDDYLRVLDDHGVLFGAVAAPSFLGSYNDYTLDALCRHRRLRGTAIVEPDIDLHSLKAMDAAGIVGIRFSLRGYAGLPDLSTPAYQRLLRRVADLGSHVHIYAEGERVAALAPVLLDAGVNLVIDHFGNPDSALGEASPGFQAALKGIETGRCWVKISAPYRSIGCDHAALAATLLREAGAERLLFGSDWPLSGTKKRSPTRTPSTGSKTAFRTRQRERRSAARRRACTASPELPHQGGSSRGPSPRP